MGGLYNPIAGIEYTDNEIVGKINAAIAKITREYSIDIVAILESETQKLMLATEREKLNSIDIGAQVNPPDLATLDPEADTKLSTVDERLSAYEAEILPPGAIEKTCSASGYDVVRVFQPVGTYSFVIASQLGDIGFTSSGYYAGGASMRFKVNIPKGAIIKRAWIIVTAGMTTPDGSVGIVRSEVAVEDTANATQITSQNDFYARPRVAVAWDNLPPWVVSAQYNSPSLVTLIQRIINKPNWEKDNAIQIFWDDRLDRSEHVTWSSRQLWLAATTSVKYPKLYIAYVMP